MHDNHVKTCPKCGTAFTVTDLLFSRELDLIGMTFENANPRFNCFYYTHDVEHCLTTFAVPVEDLQSALDLRCGSDNLAGGDQCEGHCLNLNDYDVCGQNCCWAPFRRLLRKMLAARNGHRFTTGPVKKT